MNFWGHQEGSMLLVASWLNNCFTVTWRLFFLQQILDIRQMRLFSPPVESIWDQKQTLTNPSYTWNHNNSPPGDGGRKPQPAATSHADAHTNPLLHLNIDTRQIQFQTTWPFDGSHTWCGIDFYFLPPPLLSLSGLGRAAEKARCGEKSIKPTLLVSIDWQALTGSGFWSTRLTGSSTVKQALQLL